jgi:hypothetical protein
MLTPRRKTNLVCYPKVFSQEALPPQRDDAYRVTVRPSKAHARSRQRTGLRHGNDELLLALKRRLRASAFLASAP